MYCTFSGLDFIPKIIFWFRFLTISSFCLISFFIFLFYVTEIYCFVILYYSNTVLTNNFKKIILYYNLYYILEIKTFMVFYSFWIFLFLIWRYKIFIGVLKFRNDVKNIKTSSFSCETIYKIFGFCLIKRTVYY